uniref:TF-B3 domain-containing protein n=1 Tax=Leersia perrieri TaxID=77586 RepID=A0A0D9W3K6_9ORYZ
MACGQGSPARMLSDVGMLGQPLLGSSRQTEDAYGFVKMRAQKGLPAFRSVSIGGCNDSISRPAMGSRGGDRRETGGGGAAVQLKVLVPSSFRRMRICDELAARLGLGAVGGGRGQGDATRAAAVATARVVMVGSPVGKVWDIKVGRDGDGRAFLGRGWPDFAAAHGLGVGWFVVLRHRGGVLAVEAFDTTCCLKEFGADSSAFMTSGSGIARKPQFLGVLLPDFMEKMRIPDKFVQHYLTEENLNSNTANILSSLGKSCHIELENDRSGVFLKGGWSQFLLFHGISRGDVILFRYGGNLVFKINVFGLNGRQKDFRAKSINIHQSTGKQQEAPAFPRRKCKEKNKKFGKGNENQQESPCSWGVSCKKGRKSDRDRNSAKRSRSTYEIGSSAWIKKEINEYILKRCLVSLARTFCESIGFSEESTITLIEAEGENSCGSRSWEVAGRRDKEACYLLGAGWKRFCEDNSLKVGDVCTFNVVDNTMWHVVIERS